MHPDIFIALGTNQEREEVHIHVYVPDGRRLWGIG